MKYSRRGSAAKIFTKSQQCRHLTTVVVKTKQNAVRPSVLTAAITAPAVFYKFAHLLHFLLDHTGSLAHDDSHADGTECAKSDRDAGVAFFLFGFSPKHFILLSAVGALLSAARFNGIRCKIQGLCGAHTAVLDALRPLTACT